MKRLFQAIAVAVVLVLSCILVLRTKSIHVYDNFGLYREARGEAPWTIYVDQYRKDECPQDVCE